MSVIDIPPCETLSPDICESEKVPRTCVLLRNLRDFPHGYCRAPPRKESACGICAAKSAHLYTYSLEGQRDAAEPFGHLVCRDCVRERVMDVLLGLFDNPEKTTAVQGDFEDFEYVCPVSGEVVVLSNTVAREILSGDRALEFETRLLHHAVELKIAEQMETFMSTIRDGVYELSFLASNQRFARIDKWFHHFKALKSLQNAMFDSEIQVVDFHVHDYICDRLHNTAGSGGSGTEETFLVNLSEEASDSSEESSFVHWILQLEPPSDLKMVPHVQTFMNAGFASCKFVYKNSRSNGKTTSMSRECSDMYDSPFYVDLVPYSTFGIGEKLSIEFTTASSFDDSSTIYVYSLGVRLRDAIMTKDSLNEYKIKNFCRLKLTVQNKSRAPSESGAVVASEWVSVTNVELFTGETYVIRLAVDDSRLRRKVKKHNGSRNMITMTIPEALDGHPIHTGDDLKIGLHLGSTLNAVAPYTWIGRDREIFRNEWFLAHESAIRMEASNVGVYLRETITIEDGQCLRVLLYDRPPLDARGKKEAPVETVELRERGTAYILKHKPVGTTHRPGQRYDRVVIPEDLKVRYAKVRSAIFEDEYAVNTKPKQWYLQVQILHDGRVCLLNNVQRSASGTVYACTVYTPKTFRASLSYAHDYRVKSEEEVVEWNSLSTEISENQNRRLRKDEVYDSRRVFESHLSRDKLFAACSDAVYRTKCRTLDREHAYRSMYVRFVVTERT
ncbi:hypothetical protein CYMTET_55173 [Cymbomonas tetramitiformis]|uniref:Uncharacterized protein n=1 Tax=Cymbomonas tetramitiformis TaxID=36881 RepID=A0AAE0EN33_9CHLO|nr:hypothetical protein CYMTET_55173 [Cymbomonas tetramitiformis]|eukprot:gene120-172_t